MRHDLKGSMSEGVAASDVVVFLVSPAYASSAACMRVRARAPRTCLHALAHRPCAHAMHTRERTLPHDY